MGVRHAGVEFGRHVPVAGGAERHALALTLDTMILVATDWTRPADSFGCDLLPQDGADLVAVEAVEDAAGLLCVDEVDVEIARVVRRPPGSPTR